MWGLYDHTLKLVYLAPDLGAAQYRSTLAHELGHAFYGHQGHGHLKQEHLADRWAARQLIAVEDLLDSSTLVMDVGEMAATLGVMPWVVKAFTESLNAEELSHILREFHE